MSRYDFDASTRQALGLAILAALAGLALALGGCAQRRPEPIEPHPIEVPLEELRLSPLDELDQDAEVTLLARRGWWV